MSEVTLTDEEIERQKEEQRNALRAQIAELQRKITRLEFLKGQLEEKYNDINDDVYKPESGYDLTVSTDIAHWFGDLEIEGEGHQMDTANGISTFMSGIMEVISTIDGVIARLRSEIAALQSALNAI